MPVQMFGVVSKHFPFFLERARSSLLLNPLSKVVGDGQISFFGEKLVISCDLLYVALVC